MIVPDLERLIVSTVSAQIERRRSIKIQGFLPRLSGHIMRFFVQKLQYFWPNNA